MKKQIFIVVLIIIFMSIFSFTKNKPNNLEIQNQQIIQALTEAGTNLNKEHIIEIAFYGDWEKMNKLRDYLATQGWVQVFGQGDDTLVVSKNYLLELEIINKIEQDMLKLSNEYGVKYDGWSTYPVKE